MLVAADCSRGNGKNAGVIPCLACFGLVENFVAIFGQLIDFSLQFVYAVCIPAPQSLRLLRMQLSQVVVHI